MLAALWLLWLLLLVVSLSLVTLTVGTYRTLRGEGALFGSSAPPELYTRIAGVVVGQAPDARLVPPLLALAATAWLLRTHPHPPSTAARAVRTTATALAGVLTLQAAGLVAALGYLVFATGPDDPTAGFPLPAAKLDALAPPLLSFVTLTCLAALLTLVLVHDSVRRREAASAARGTLPAGPLARGRPAAAEDRADGTFPPTPMHKGSRHLPSDSRRDHDAERAVADPHAAYRRPQP